MTQWKVSFEFVSPSRYTQFYCDTHGEHPKYDPAAVPDEYWDEVNSAKHDKEEALHHLHGLHKLISEGELIRNPRMWSSPDPVWTEVVVARVL